jgi:hypothetical protein
MVIAKATQLVEMHWRAIKRVWNYFIDQESLTRGRLGRNYFAAILAMCAAQALNAVATSSLNS